MALDRVTAEGFRDRAAIVNVQSQGIQADASPTEPQTRAERKADEQAARERAQAEERELAEKRAQAQTLEEQEQLVEPRV